MGCFLCDRCVWSDRSTRGHAVLRLGHLSWYHHESSRLSLQNDCKPLPLSDDCLYLILMILFIHILKCSEIRNCIIAFCCSLRIFYITHKRFDSVKGPQIGMGFLFYFLTLIFLRPLILKLQPLTTNAFLMPFLFKTKFYCTSLYSLPRNIWFCWLTE